MSLLACVIFPSLTEVIRQCSRSVWLCTSGGLDQRLTKGSQRYRKTLTDVGSRIEAVRLMKGADAQRQYSLWTAASIC